ncbi:hypothetical protein CPC16_009905 [Podila verticillata]|nr:hypothetical protein CPC16_009905 [Podila verticillata]
MTDNRMSLFCLVDGEATPFSMTISSSDTVDGLKNLIVYGDQAPAFRDVAAKDLTLWRVSIPDDDDNGLPITLDSVAEKKKLKATAKLSKIFDTELPEDTIHIIVQRPPPAASLSKRKWLSSVAEGRMVKRKLDTAPYSRGEGSLVFSDQHFRGFPLNDKSNFESIRANPQFAYFDRTRYITELQDSLENVILFLRPRRFGKSLFVSTLAHFHGVEHAHNYAALFEGLDVARDVKSRDRTIKAFKPGLYLIMAFDFSAVNRSNDVNKAAENLNNMINDAIFAFCRTYAHYLGEDTCQQLEAELHQDAGGSLDVCVDLISARLEAVWSKDDVLYNVKGIYLLADECDAFSNEYLDPDDPARWNHFNRVSNLNSILKGFWSIVKSKLGPRRIAKCFITGVSPLSMADHTSGFNVATNVSWWKEYSGLCGLTEEDVKAALKLPSVCESEEEIAKHLKIMKENYNGYNFVESGTAPHIFNTNTCLEYLDGVIRRKPINPVTVSNSEVSVVSLQILAASPIACGVVSDSLRNRFISYDELPQTFSLTTFATDVMTSVPAFISYMVHIGGLTFRDNCKQVQLPNHIAALRFGNAVLMHHNLRLQDVSLAFQNIVSTGSIHRALLLYEQLMQARDPSGSHERIDMTIHVPSRKRLLILEWKAIQIDFLDSSELLKWGSDCRVNMSTQGRKLECLTGFAHARQILDLKFTTFDNSRSGMLIREWVLKGPSQASFGTISPQEQLAEYIASPTVTGWKKEKGIEEVLAYLVVVVGSRRILIWEMDKDGCFRKDPQLAAQPSDSHEV